jgi:RNA polymerase sigma-70 factor (ECF subfamily)
MRESNLHPKGAMSLASSPRSRLEPAVVQAAYQQHSTEILNFLRGVLRDAELAQDCLQITFIKAIEHGHTADEASLKSWLFRVAFNAAMEAKRRQQTGQRAVERLADRAVSESESPALAAVRADEVQRVRLALEGLSPEQQTITQMRIFEQKKFATIAAELNLPLGTVLTRMRSALEKLRRALADGE